MSEAALPDAAAPVPHRLPARVLRRLDGVFFAFAGVAAVWLAYLLLRLGVRPGWPLLLLLPFWLVVTYLTLPRIHRILTFVYVPGYFIGRTRTSDGLLGDPVNLALRGSEAEVHAAMVGTGWTRADDLSLRTGLHIVSTTLRRRSYAAAPVSPLNLFDRPQDFAYQQEVAGSPSKRHHVRFWRCPEGWFLPGGVAVDWLAAGTYDRSVGLSLFTLQVTHEIAPDTDVERDVIVSSLAAARPGTHVEVIRHFSSAFHTQRGRRPDRDRRRPAGGRGRCVARTAGGGLDRPHRQPRPRPSQTVFGGAVALVRQDPDLLAVLARQVVAVLVAALLVLLALLELGLGLAGRNWARVWLMGSAVLTTLLAFGSRTGGTTRAGLLGLPATATAVLLLLALSSHRARDFGPWPTPGRPDRRGARERRSGRPRVLDGTGSRTDAR